MSFRSSLSVGSIGETLFFEAHNGQLHRMNGRKHDFVRLQTGATIELKTDTYSMEKTPNFFFERYSDKKAGKPGGPWQAQVNGINEFSYMYVQNLMFFTFDTNKLVERLEVIKTSCRTVSVANDGWITEGFVVPREMVLDLATKKTLKIYVE